jgi:hypothetical protein
VGEEAVSREEVRKLIGGYATGSLSAAERKLLFEAALQDQELFDELAHEQELKELIETPGVRERLLSALQPRQTARPAWWARPWSWIGVAGALSAAMVVWIVSTGRTPQPVEVASVEAPGPPAEKAAAPSVAPPPAVSGRAAAKAGAAPQPSEEPAAGPAEQELAKTEAAGAATAPFAAPPAEAAAAPLQLEQPPAAAGRAGFSPEAARQAVLSARTAADAAAPLAAFDYTLANGMLRITPAMEGFLTVSSGDTAMFPKSPVRSNVPIVLPVPAGAVEIAITFSLDDTPPPGETARRAELSGRIASATERVVRVALQVP